MVNYILPREVKGSQKQNWLRVSKSNPCPVCGKPDWCLISADGLAVLCPRVESPDRHGEAGYLHHLGEVPSAASYGTVSNYGNPSLDFPLASPDRLHYAYSTLLDCLYLDSAHAANLVSRGLSDDVIAANQYRSLPADGHAGIAAGVAAQGKVAGVPGFYKSTKGVELAGQPGLIVPIKDLAQRIVGVQIRRDAYDGQGSKYVWLSSSGRSYGCSPGSPVHVAIPQELTTTEWVFITEGGLKADVIAYFTGAVVLGIPGVTMWRRAIPTLVNLLPLAVVLAFDNDRFSNSAVEKSYESLKATVLANRFNCYVARWPKEHKGLDDWLKAVGGKEVLKVQTIFKASLEKPYRASKPYYKESLAKSYKTETSFTNLLAWQTVNEAKPYATHIVGPDRLPPFAMTGCICLYCEAARRWMHGSN